MVFIDVTFGVVIGECGVVFAMVFAYVDMTYCCANGFGASVVFDFIFSVCFSCWSKE